MLEVTGNLWTYPAHVRVITTNGTIKKDGTAVMGRGCAAEAKERFPGIEKTLGDLLARYGNKPHELVKDQLLSFPVKHAWHEMADIKLIEDSAKALANWWFLQFGPNPIIVLPRPGCGNGRLPWDYVKLVLAPILDDRFRVITFGPPV